MTLARNAQGASLYQSVLTERISEGHACPPRWATLQSWVVT
jgi:hypothetical protein